MRCTVQNNAPRDVNLMTIYTSTGNFWLYTMLGYGIRLSGSKFFGAELRGLFWWMADLCAKGAGLLVRCHSPSLLAASFV